MATEFAQSKTPKFWRVNVFIYVRHIAGAVLIVAVILKLHEIVMVRGRVSAFSMSVAAVEWALGMWMLYGHPAKWVKLAGVVTFLTFSLWAAYRLLHRETSCGCFGTVEIPPAFMLAVDLMFVAGWLISRPASQGSVKNYTFGWIAGAAAPIAVLCVLGIGLSVGLLQRAGLSVDVVAATTTSSTATHSVPPVEITRIDLGFIEPGSTHVGTYVVPNPSNHDMKILRSEVECVCTKVMEFPQSIKAGGTGIVRVEFHAPDIRSHYSKRINLVRDASNPSVIALTLTARIGLPLSVTPSPAKIVSGERENVSETLIEVFNEGKEPIKLLYSTSEPAGAFVLIPNRALQPTERQQIAVRVKSTPKEAMPASYVVSIKTDSEVQPILPVSVEYAVKK